MPVTLKEAAERLGCERVWLRGFIDGLGDITLHPVATAMVMTEADFARLRRAYDTHRKRQSAA